MYRTMYRYQHDICISHSFSDIIHGIDMTFTLPPLFHSYPKRFAQGARTRLPSVYVFTLRVSPKLT